MCSNWVLKLCSLYFCQILTEPELCRQILEKTSNFFLWKTIHWEPSHSAQTDRHYVTNSLFSRFYYSASNGAIYNYEHCRLQRDISGKWQELFLRLAQNSFSLSLQSLLDCP